MPDLRPQSALFRLTRTVLQTGLRPQDGEELQLAKNLLNLASALFAIATLLWLAACLGANSPLPVASFLYLVFAQCFAPFGRAIL